MPPAYRLYPLSPRWKAAGTPASASTAQTRSCADRRASATVRWDRAPARGGCAPNVRLVSINDRRLCLGRNRIGERQHRGSEDALLVGESPIVFEPAVERGQRRHRRVDVEPQRLFDAAAHRGEQHDGVESLAIHDLETAISIAILGVDGLDLAQRTRIDAGRHLPPKEQIDAAGNDDGIERRVRDEAVDLASRHDDRAAAVHEHPHAAPAKLGRRGAG